MKDVGSLQVLKRKLHLPHPFLNREKSTKMRKIHSQDSISTTSNSSSQASTHSQANQGKYPILKLNDNLTLSIGDSIESNPNRSTDTASKFEYGPIRYPKQIRLLLVLPSCEQDEPLETLLFHADLCEVPFQALSLHSVDAPKSRVMHCNGKGLPVTESLHSALLAVRNLGDTKALSIVWADEICVNHADVKEREAHLRLFRDIHNSSVVTTVWLGGTPEQQEKVFKTVDMLHEACQCDEFRERLERDELDLSSLDHLSIGEKTLQISQENRAELAKLFSHPWFEQVWGFQEVVVSKKAFVLYGNGVRPWSYIADAAWCMHQLHWESGLNPDFSLFGDRSKLKHHHVLHLDDHRDGCLDGKCYGLLELLTASRNFSAPQPLDRVFALCGLLGNTKEHEIAEAFFDYSLSPRTLFVNMTLNMMLCHETLDILHLATNDPVAKPNWPSFVPDLTCKNSSRQIGARTGRDFWEYHASGNTKPQLRIFNGEKTWGGGSAHVIPRFREDARVGLKGVVVDEVVAVGSEMKETGIRVASFLADWVNVAMMTGDKKFYTTVELNKARDVLANVSAAEPKLIASDSIPENLEPGKEDVAPESPTRHRRPSVGTGIAEFPVGSRRASLVGVASRRSSVTAESKGSLHSSFSPALLDALKVLDIQASDSSAVANDGSGRTALKGKSQLQSTSNLPDKKYPLGDESYIEAFWRTLVRDRDRDGLRPVATTGETHFQPWFEAANGGASTMLEALQSGVRDDKGERVVSTFNDWVHAASANSRIMRTKEGYIGTGTRFVKEGDLVCVLYGGQTPFVLRPDAGGNYRLIGDCYVHGIMEGEALKMNLKEKEFVLV